MREFHPRFSKARCDVVLVLCQKRSSVASYFEGRPTPFPVVADEDRSAAKRWGVYVALSYDAIRIARPASFVVDAERLVRYAYLSRHQMDHPSLDDVLAVASAL